MQEQENIENEIKALLDTHPLGEERQDIVEHVREECKVSDEHIEETLDQMVEKDLVMKINGTYRT